MSRAAVARAIAPADMTEIVKQLTATANRALDVAEQVATVEASASGESVSQVLSRRAWPQLDDARKALEEAMGVALEILEEAAAKLDAM